MKTQTGKKWFRIIPPEIKSQILQNIKEHGKSVPKMAEEYWVWSQTIYSWIKKDTEYKNPKSWSYSVSAIREINKLKKDKVNCEARESSLGY